MESLDGMELDPGFERQVSGEREKVSLQFFFS